MKINVTRARENPGSRERFHFVVSAAKLGIDDPCFSGDVAVDGHAACDGALLRVEGLVRTTGNFQCGRCLALFTREMEIPFAELYKHRAEAENCSGGEAVCYDGDEIDIGELIRESVLAALPMRMICRPDCRGLCVKCGANLNETDCGCDRRVLDPRLAALEKFFDKK